MAERERWDEVYAREPHLYTTEPNALLVETVRDLAPGKALDLGMGQGRNALWLAARGWDVTGVDISGEGIRLAAAAGGNLRTVHSAIEDFDLGRAEWDLIAGLYVHGVLLRESRRIIAALKPGGLLVVEGFHRDVMKEGVDGLTGGLLGFTTNALLRQYLSLRVLLYQETRAPADWRRINAPLVRFVGQVPACPTPS